MPLRAADGQTLLGQDPSVVRDFGYTYGWNEDGTPSTLADQAWVAQHNWAIGYGYTALPTPALPSPYSPGGLPGQTREPLAGGQLQTVTTFINDNWPMVLIGVALAFVTVRSGVFQR